jgi:hypothetical protein
MVQTDNTRFQEFVYSVYKSMKSFEIFLVYEGIITHGLIKTFAELTETSITKPDDPQTIQQRVFHVLVETLQNISKHSDENEISSQKDSRGIFVVARSPGEYSITTGNLVTSAKKEEISTLLNNINHLTRSELDDLYKNQILQGHVSQRGGAGLGFIDIRRKTGKKFDYSFVPVEKKCTSFCLSAFIPRKL